MSETDTASPRAGKPIRLYSEIRSSPERRVTCSRSRYSGSGMAYFLDTCVSSLKPATLRFAVEKINKRNGVYLDLSQRVPFTPNFLEADFGAVAPESR